MQMEANYITNLPQQIVTEPDLPWGSDQQLWVGTGAGVQAAWEQPLCHVWQLEGTAPHARHHSSNSLCHLFTGWTQNTRVIPLLTLALVHTRKH
jgi:hypothetical protein